MASIQPIEIADPDRDEVLVRNGITIALFLEPFVHQCADALIGAFDLFVRSIPGDALKWAVVSATAEQWREVTPAVIDRMRDSLKPPGSQKRKLTGFRVNDFGDEAPQYGLRILDRSRDSQFPESRTLAQMTFPPRVADDGEVDGLWKLVVTLAEMVKPVSGYCAPSLLTSDGKQSAAFAALRPLALRFPGYDVAMNDLTALDISDRVRGARWITILGPVPMAALGGSDAIRAALPSGIEVQDVAGGTIVRAGRQPEIGDQNRRIGTPLLNAVARVLEPITLFSEPDLLSNLADFDEQLLSRWERRFL